LEGKMNSETVDITTIMRPSTTSKQLVRISFLS